VQIVKANLVEQLTAADPKRACGLSAVPVRLLESDGTDPLRGRYAYPFGQQRLRTQTAWTDLESDAGLKTIEAHFPSPSDSPHWRARCQPPNREDEEPEYACGQAYEPQATTNPMSHRLEFHVCPKGDAG